MAGRKNKVQTNSKEVDSGICGFSLIQADSENATLYENFSDDA